MAITIIVLIVVMQSQKTKLAASKLAAPVTTSPAAPASGANSAAVATALAIYDHKWVRCSATSWIYIIESGKKRHVDADTYTKMNAPATTEISCDVLSTIPDGEPYVALDAQQTALQQTDLARQAANTVEAARAAAEVATDAASRAAAEQQAILAEAAQQAAMAAAAASAAEAQAAAAAALLAAEKTYAV